MRTWKLPLLVGGLSAVVVFGAAALAFGGAGVDRGAMSADRGTTMMLVAEDDAASAEAWQGCGRSGLMQDPQAREDMWALRDEHRAEMRAWWDKYGGDPDGEAAQQALGQLREEHFGDMRDLFEKYGIEPPAGFGQGGSTDRGSGCGAGAPGAGCDGQGPGAGQGMMGGAGAWSSGQVL